MPGYTSDLYNYIVGIDPTFKNDISFDQFKSKMSDVGYSKNMYDWIGQNDKTFHSDVSFDAFREKLGYKKKEPTVSPSVQKPKPISSGTQPKVTQKPSGTSVSGKPEGLYSAPGNELAVFKKTSDGWYVDNNRSGNFIKLQKGDVEKRVATLESTAKKFYDPTYEQKTSWQAAPSKQEVKPTAKESKITERQFEEPIGKELAQKAFDEEFFIAPKKGMSSVEQVNFVAREKAKKELGEGASEQDLLNAEQKYKESGTLKMLQRKGYDVDINGSINDPKSQKALAQFNANEDLRLKAEAKQDKLSNSIDNIVNSKLMGLTEEQAVPQLNKQFGKYGFVFDKAGIGDAMTVRYSADGITYTDPVDIDLQSGDPVEQMNLLKSFMKSKYLNDSEVAALNDEKLDAKKLVKITLSDPQKYAEYGLSEGQFENYITSEYRNANALKIQIDNKLSDFNKLSQQYNATGDENILNQLRSMESSIKNDQEKLAYNVADIEQTERKYKESVGSYILQKEKQGNFIGGLFASAAKGVASAPKMLMNIGMDVLPELLPNAGLNPLEYQKMKDEGFSDAQIENKVSSQLKRTIGKEINQGITNIGSLGTIQNEYFSSVDRNILEQAVNGLAESVGAAATGGGNAIAQGLAFFGMSYNAMQDELSSKEFDELDKWEKQAISGVYGLVIGQLEKIGFNMSAGQMKNPLLKKFTSTVVKNALKDMPENATIETIDQLIGTSLKNTMRATGAKVVNGALSEGATEGIQSLAETSMKDIVNKIHGKKVFEYIPDLTTKKGIADALGSALYEAAAGAIGGAIMGSFDTYRQSRVNEQSDEKFENMYQSLMDSNTLKAVKLNEIEKYKNGNISREQMQSNISEINTTVATLNKIPTELDTRGKRVAYELLSERDGLQSKIQGKDPNLVATEINRINEIDNQLKIIGENAVKESTKPVEEVTAEGGGVQYQGTQEGQPEVGQGERPVGETAQPETDLGNRPVESRSAEEEKIITNLEQKINQYESEQATEGIGAEETVTTDEGKQVKRVKLRAPKNTNTKAAIAIETGTNPRAAVLKYFVSGGKINSTAIQKLFGDKQGKPIKGEVQNRLSFIDNKIGKTPEQIAEYLWMEYGDQFGMTDVDFIPFVEEVISEFKGTTGMVNELLSYENKTQEDYYKQKYGDNFEGYDVSELEDAESVLDYMTDEEIIQMSNEIEAAEADFAKAPEVVTPEETIEDLKALDVTDKTNLQKVQSFLDKLDKDIDKFGKETLGVNLPVAVAKAVIKTLKTLVDAGVSLEQALKQAAEIHNVSEVDIVDSFEEVRQKETEASKAAKKISRPTQKKVVVNEATALKDQLRLEARAAREAKGDINSKRKMLANTISNMATKGIIKSTQAAALSKRIGYLNLDNPVMVDRFLSYAEKVFDRADYQEKLNDAFKLRNKIKRASKSKDKLQAEVAGMAKKFSKIDPSLVEDIDTYMEIADKVYNAVRPVIKIAADISAISEYRSKELKRQEEILKQEVMDMYKYLVDSGAISSEMSLKEIKDVITILENNPEANIADRESIIRDYVKKAFDVYSGIIIDMVKTGVDPLTGEEISFDENQKDIIKRLIGIDTDFMKLEDAYKSIEALDNFIVNKITSGVEAIVNSYEGKLNADVMAKSGIKTRPLKLFFTKIGGRAMAENFASLPVLIDNMFTGINIGQKFMNLSGLNDFSNGVAKATKELNNIINEYGQQFEKSKPNGMNFRAAENVYERGMVAYLSRTIDGTIEEQRSELGRRIGIIRDSIESLKDGDKDQKKIADIYESLYEKLGLEEFNKNNDNLTITDIQSRADKANMDAVKWWIDKWAGKYSDLSDVSLSVYNTELGSDINYTPDRYSKITGKDNPISDINLQKAGSFGMDLNFTDKNKTGVLMETTRPKKTPGRYVNLDFDISNARSMKAALVDINTAGSVRKIDGFLKSPSMNKIIEEKKDRELLQRRINSYIRRSKHKAVITDSTLRDLDSALNYVASIGAVKALGGVLQPIKQTVPVMINTIFNAGPQNMSFASVFGDSDMHEWINKSGMAIANRGLEASTAVETANKYLDKIAGSKGEAVTKGLMKLNEFWLKKFLQQPDVWIARSSFIAYYKQALRRKGVDVSKIDWKNHPIDKEAANYAQHMVDRQQNVSDASMMGEMMASESGAFKIMRKTLLPFANFIMNQKSRMYSDFRTVFSSEANEDDKKAAVRSLSGLTLEIGMYQYLSYMIGMGIKSLAANLVGYEADDEEEKKNKKYAIQNATNQYIKDILSPLPTFDGATLAAFNWIADKLQNTMISEDEIKAVIEEANKIKEEMGEDPMDEKQTQKFKEEFINNSKFQFEDYKSNKLFNLGTISIAADKISELYDMEELARTGKFTEESFGTEKTKYISKEDQKLMSYLTALKFASLSGALPVEANNLSLYSTKYIKKKAITENQLEKSQEVKKELGIKELKDYQNALIKSSKKADGIIEEIDWIENNGGLKNKKQEQEYIRLLQKGQELSYDDLKKIQSIK